MTSVALLAMHTAQAVITSDCETGEDAATAMTHLSVPKTLFHTSRRDTAVFESRQRHIEFSGVDATMETFASRRKAMPHAPAQ